MAQLNDDVNTQIEHGLERELRARITELEALLEARTQTIVGMGARLAELEGNPPPALAERARHAEAALEQLRSTKVVLVMPSGSKMRSLRKR